MGGVPVVESAAVDLGEEGAVEVSPAVDGRAGKAELLGDGGVGEAGEDHFEGELLGGAGEGARFGFLRFNGGLIGEAWVTAGKCVAGGGFRRCHIWQGDDLTVVAGSGEGGDALF